MGTEAISSGYRGNKQGNQTLKVGETSKPFKNSRIGTDSPRTGAPSMISNFVMVSLLFSTFGPVNTID